MDALRAVILWLLGLTSMTAVYGENKITIPLLFYLNYEYDKYIANFTKGCPSAKPDQQMKAELVRHMKQLNIDPDFKYEHITQCTLNAIDDGYPVTEVHFLLDYSSEKKNQSVFDAIVYENLQQHFRIYPYCDGFDPGRSKKEYFWFIDPRGPSVDGVPAAATAVSIINFLIAVGVTTHYVRKLRNSERYNKGVHVLLDEEDEYME